MPLGNYGLADAVRNYFEAGAAKRRRRDDDIARKLNEEIARFKFEESKKEAAQFEDYITLLEREATPTYPTAPGTAQVARPFQMQGADKARLEALKGVYKYPSPTYQKYETDSEFGAFDPTTGQFIKRGNIPAKPSGAGGFSLSPGQTRFGFNPQTKKYEPIASLEKPGGEGKADPRWEQAVDNAYRQLTGGVSDILMESMALMQANPNMSYAEAKMSVIDSKNIDFDKLMVVANQYYQKALAPGGQAQGAGSVQTIRDNLRQQGFKDEDIDAELKRRGLIK